MFNTCEYKRCTYSQIGQRTSARELTHGSHLQPGGPTYDLALGLHYQIGRLGHSLRAAVANLPLDVSPGVHLFIIFNIFDW